MTLLRSTLLVLLVSFAAHAKGIYDPRNDLQQIILPECGSSQYSPVLSSTSTLSGNTEPPIPTVLEKPPVNWIPDPTAPRVIGHTYHIFKTILRPQVFRQMVIVPILQRYIRTFQAPVLETVHIQREIPF